MKTDGVKNEHCTMERQGVWRGKGKIATNSHDHQKYADDLVNRNFTAHRPNQL